jgi:hypothetical protein
MSAIYVCNNIDSFKVLFRKNLGSFRKRLLNCDNKLVHSIVTSVYFMFNSSHTANWQNFLFT